MIKTKIRCAVSGIVTGCRPDVFDKRVEKYGSAEAMANAYVCSEAKRALRQGKSIDEIRADSKARGINVDGLPAANSLDHAVEAFAAKTVKAVKSSTSSTSSTSSKGKALDNRIDTDVNSFVKGNAKTVATVG